MYKSVGEMVKRSFHRDSDGDINTLKLELGNDIYPDSRFYPGCRTKTVNNVLVSCSHCLLH